MSRGGCCAAAALVCRPGVARLQQTLLRQISRANRRFGLIEPGDRLMVAISGGKDSGVMLLGEERDLAAFAVEQGFPVAPCDLCGSQDNRRRVEVRRLLTQLEAANPDVRRSLLAAAGNVKPSHLLEDRLRADGDDDEVAAEALVAPQMLVRA